MSSPLGVRTRRSLLLVALLVCIAVLATGCSGDDGDSADGELLTVLAQAADQAATVETLRVRVEQSYVGVPGMPDEPIVTDMVTTVDGRRARGTASRTGVEGEVLVVDEAIYFTIDGMSDGMWVRIGLDELEELTGIDFAATPDQTLEDALARLRAAGEVTAVGTEEIDGLALTRYHAVVRTDALRNEAFSDEAIERARGMLGDTHELDVWLDDQGYPRRLEFVIDLAKAPNPPPGTPRRGEIRYVQTFLDFGEPVDVTAPPDSKVIDFSDLN